MSSPMVRSATLLLMRHAGRMDAAHAVKDWVSFADHRTSADDARIALRYAVEEWREHYEQGN